MKPCFVIVQYRPLMHLPPLLSLLLTLKQLGCNFHYIGAKSELAENFLKENGIPYDFIPYGTHNRGNRGVGKLRSLFFKFRRFVEFLPKRKKLLKRLAELQDRYGVVVPWYQETLSAALVGDKAIKRFPVSIVTLYELCDTYGSRWYGFHYEAFIKKSIVVVPEINRAWILAAKFGLEVRPFVIANKPVMHPRTRSLPLTGPAQAAFNDIGERFVFLYQGELHADRKDVLMVLETIAKNRPECCIVVMPAKNVAKERLGKYPNAYLLPRVPAPGHLAITSHASVGLAFYNGINSGLDYLNGIYCAPNKIYEYAGFGIPTLGNKIPGLEYSIGAAGAGVCCDLSEESILAAVDELMNNYAKYKTGALKFFEDTNVEDQVNAVIAHAQGLVVCEK